MTRFAVQYVAGFMPCSRKLVRRAAMGGGWLIALCCLLAGTAAAALAEELSATPETAIEAGRDALLDGSNPPWYDSKSDGLKRADLPRDFERPNWSISPEMAKLLMEALAWLAWTALALLLVGVIYLIVKTILLADASGLSAGGGTAPTKVISPAKMSALPFNVEQPPSDFLAAARKCYQQGDYSKCVVYFYSHLLLELDERHVVRLSRGKTNRQYVREAAARPALADYLQRTMLMFEHVFFGRHQLERQEIDPVWNQLEDFHAKLGEIGA